MSVSQMFSCQWLKSKDLSEFYVAYAKDSRMKQDGLSGFQQMINKATTHPNALIIRRNRIGVNSATAISHILQDKQNLTHLDLHENVIRDAGAIALCDNLLSHPTCFIRYLDIGSNDIGVNGISHLAEFIASGNCRLHTLILGSEANDLYCNKFDHQTAAKLCSSIKQAPSLQYLDLNRNVLMGNSSQVAFKIMATWFQVKPRDDDPEGNADGSVTPASIARAATSRAQQLEILPQNSDEDDEDERKYREILSRTESKSANGGINGTGSSDTTGDVIPQLGKSASSNESQRRHYTRLHTLKVAYCSMHTSSALNILNSIVSSSYYKLRVLDFGGNQLQSEICEPLAQYISHPGCILQSLLINHNQLGRGGVEKLSDALTMNSTLNTLNLAHNDIGDSGARIVADILKHNHSLLHINLKGNNLGVASCTALSSALESNSTLKTLLLSKNKLQDEGTAEIGQVLQNHTSLSLIDLSSCSIGDKGAMAIVFALGTNRSIQTLRMCNNHLTDDSGKAFLEILTKNCDLTNIDLRGNQIEHATQLRLRKVLRSNKSARLTKGPEALKREVIRLKYIKHLLEEAQVELHETEKKRSDTDHRVETFIREAFQEKEKYESNLDTTKQSTQIEEQTINEINAKSKITKTDHTKWMKDTEEKLEWLEKTLEQLSVSQQEKNQLLKKATEELITLQENQESGVDDLKNQVADAKRQLKEQTDIKMQQMKEIATLKEKLEQHENKNSED